MTRTPRSRSAGTQGAHTDFRDAMSYGDYLRLPQLLACQAPRSREPDELLFIIAHQSTELWLKLMIHEIEGAIASLAADRLPPVFKMLARVSRAQTQLIQTWDVLSTLTPADYLAFRDSLGKSSGFQSYQYRTLEFLLGNKNRAMLTPHRHDPAVHAALTTALERPSLYDEAIGVLARRGFRIAKRELEREWSKPREPGADVRAAWLAVYRDTARHWELYELAEELIDLEDAFLQWRFRHVTTVERIIGNKPGTGGTVGVRYLRAALDIRLFPELWEVRTEL